MALSLFTKALDEIPLRQGNAFFSDDDGTTWYSAGVVADLAWNSEPVKVRADSTGREIQIGHDISLSFVLLQSAYEKQVLGVKDLTGTAVAANGIWIRLTDRPSTTANAGTADGVTFKNVTPGVGVEMNYAGSESIMNVEMGARLGLDAFDDFAATGGTVTFDA